MNVSFEEMEKIASFLKNKRKAYALAAYWMMKDIRIENTDILAGNLEIGNISSTYPCDIEQEIENLEKDKKISLGEYDWALTAREIGLLTRAPGAHLIPAYDVLLHTGLQNKLERIKRKMQESLNDTGKYSFYRSVFLVVSSMQKYIERYAIEAKRIYEKTKNENIKRMYEACEWIVFQPPRSFFEAVQLVLFAHMCVLDEGGSGSISFGRIDQYLYPYYQKDMEEGVVTQEEAQQIINALWEKIAKCEKTWQNITIGGCDKNGKEWELAEQHELNEFLDFPSFYEWYKRELVHFTKRICRFGNDTSKQYAKYWPIPFTSSLMQGCIEKGKDVTDCGTIYHNLTVDCVGVASVANSLEAMEELVFKEKVIGLTELSDALKHNFNGYEVYTNISRKKGASKSNTDASGRIF